MLNFKNKKLWILLPTFLVAELCLWFVILFCPHSALGLSISCFSAVALAFVFALCFIKKDIGVLLLISGLLFTVCADIFLVLPQDLQYKQQVAGMVFFSVTQLVYFAYLFWKTESKKMRIAHSIIRGTAVVIAEIVMLIVLGKNTDVLSVLSLFYIANLAVSVVFAYMQGKKSLLFAIGLTLFLCCDLFVGFSIAIGEYIQVAETSLLYKIIHADFNFVWFFYLPSQACIASYTALQSEKLRV
jgi:hypothetical protein